jgi:hypothetical protein
MAGSISIVKDGATARTVAHAGLGILGAIAFHITTGIFALIVIPPALVVARRLKGDRLVPTGLSWPLLATLGVVGASAAVLAGYVYEVTRAVPATTETVLYDENNVLTMSAPLWPWLIGGTLGAVVGVKRRDASTAFLACVALGAVGMATFLQLPHDNEYKFVYLASFPLAFLTLVALRVGFRRGRATRLLSIGVATLLSVSTVALLAVSQIEEKNRRARLVDRYSYSDTHVTGKRAKDEVWAWVRANLPSESIVVIPPRAYKDAPMMLLSERLPFVVRASVLTAHDPQFERRYGLVKKLYTRHAARPRIEALEAIKEDLAGGPAALWVPPGVRMNNLLDPDDAIFAGPGGTIFRIR